MDSRLQALQDTLIKGLIPLADLTGKVGDSLDSDTVMPTKEALWEVLSNSLLLAAAGNHSWNSCCHDMFKTDLHDNYKALCNNKHPIGSEFFGDDFTERRTRSNKSVSQKYKGSSKPFLVQRGRSQRPFNQTDCETVVTQPEVSSGPITITGGRITNFFCNMAGTHLWQNHFVGCAGLQTGVLWAGTYSNWENQTYCFEYWGRGCLRTTDPTFFITGHPRWVAPWIHRIHIPSFSQRKEEWDFQNDFKSERLKAFHCLSPF